MASFKGEYGESKNGNFKVVDIIPTTHAFCITPAHVNFAADKRGGLLDEIAIKESGKPCGVTGCNMAFEDHTFALLVACKIDMCGPNGEAVPELHEYLLAAKEECVKNGYVGFSFLKKF